MLRGADIREKFLAYFESKGHRRVPSSSLVPAGDPTLLFTNAGMNQFKDVFLGLEKRAYPRACSAQKCVRAGGKHNDLENVGFTNRHHTFFEMLGNFSFGDYFKREAVQYAWELVTSKSWFGIDPQKLYATVFEGTSEIPRDSDAEKLWLEVGVPKERVFAFGLKDNFWQMGDTGPCGPCSEMFYDMGTAASDLGHKDCKFGCDCGRYVEIWNLVFMQFDRHIKGKLAPLPRPCVDTGMGLERTSAVLQSKISNYDTDLFQPLIHRAAELCRVDMKKELEKEAHSKQAASLRVIADHARACTFLISDGVVPSNEGRGYVLRKILRRGMRHGHLLGATKPFLYEMSHAVRDEMKNAYPELVENAERVSKVIYEEERRFSRTLAVGLAKLEELITPHFSGKDAFSLYETYGVPFDFIADVLRDSGIDIADLQSGFDKAMNEERERAKASWKGGGKQSASPAFRELKKTDFSGYRDTQSSGREILAIISKDAGVRELKPGDEADVVLDRTPFYAESGGQVGDTGWLRDSSGNVLAEVVGCYPPVQGVRAHRVIARQPLHVGMKVSAVVNSDVRHKTMRNHTATHLLHAALRETLGKHVKQAGSLVAPDHLRFDFSHFTSVADEELQDIEDLINQEVLRNTKVEEINDVPLEVAINEMKAMALFGEKYGDKVRVIRIGDFSVELCGGTHTAQTGEIGLVKLLHEGSVSSGVRRVEAVSGEGSLAHFRRDHQLERMVHSLIGSREASSSPAEALKAELEKREAENKRLAKELEQARMKSAAAKVSSADAEARIVKGVKVLAQRVDNLERPQLRTLVDNLRGKLGSGVVVLGSVSDGDGQKKVALIVGVTKDLTGRIQAGKIIAPIAQKVGGSGGGRPDMAEAGGKDPAALDSALSDAYAVVESLLA